MSVVAVFAGLLIERANKQATAVTRITECGGYVAFDDGLFQIGSGPAYVESSALLTHIRHSVTSVFVDHKEYCGLQPELLKLKNLKRIVFFGDTSKCDIAKIKRAFPDTEIVDLSSELMDCFN